jgi:DedD protein
MEMVKPISDEEVQLRKRARRRLIGAIAIVTAVVVALPMVLDNEPKPLTQEIDIRIPSQDAAGPFISKVVPVPDPSQAPSKPAAEPKSEVKSEGTSAAQSSVAPKPQPAAEEKPAPNADKAPTAPPARKAASAPKTEPQPSKAPAAPGQYVVQVVALSDAGKAKQMQQAILKTGVKAYTEVVKTARGDVTRVRAGPYASREAAEKAQQRLKGAGFDGKVVPAR